MNCSRKQKRYKQSGSALLITVIGIFTLSAATLLVLGAAANGVHLNNKQRAGATAFNIAESGAEVAALWLKNQSSAPGGTTPIYPFSGAQTLGEGTYTVTINPDPANATTFLKLYKIVSVGTVRGTSRTVQVVVQQASFGRYAYFTDSEISSISGGAISWKAGETVDGPAHSNNTSGSNFNINYNGSTSPIFLDMLTAAGNTINYTPSRPTNESTFNKIFLNGSKGYQLGVTPILLPSSSDAQKNAAWGTTSGFPSSSSGVYLRAGVNGGVYIRGDAALAFTINSMGDQVLTVTQGSSNTSLTFNRASQSISTSGPLGSGSSSNASSLGTGVIYSTGNITSLKGQIADNRVVNNKIDVRTSFTIATDVNAGKYIRITDSLNYKTQPDKTKDMSDSANLLAATLGLVAKDIRISSTAPRNLDIDAVCLAGGQNTSGGSFYVENYDDKTPVGTLNVTGGIIQKSRGPVGTFNPSTGITSTGYQKAYTYDPRLATNPPPYFPTTGQYERLSWQVLAN